MADGRPGSGRSAAAMSQHSHHTISSSEKSAHHHHAPAHSARTGGAGVALLDTGADPYDRFKLMFTGPDGIRDHRVKRVDDSDFPGIGSQSRETTSNLGYMFRMPKEFPFPKGKHGRLGEIGGEIEIWNLKKGL